jgi:hypothetical protein
MLHVVFCGSQVTTFAVALPNEQRDLRHGASKPQKAALSQNPINATIHRRQGTLSLVRRSPPTEGVGVVEDFILEQKLASQSKIWMGLVGSAVFLIAEGSNYQALLISLAARFNGVSAYILPKCCITNKVCIVSVAKL